MTEKLAEAIEFEMSVKEKRRMGLSLPQSPEIVIKWAV